MRHYVVKNFLHVSLSMIVLFFTNKYAAYNKKNTYTTHLFYLRLYKNISMIVYHLKQLIDIF